MVNDSLSNGAINASLMGLLGGLVESIIILIVGVALAGVAGLLVAGLGVILIAFLTLIHIVIAAAGGAVGSAIKG
jgi:hypothetical protein